eukprot:511123_1
MSSFFSGKNQNFENATISNFGNTNNNHNTTTNNTNNNTTNVLVPIHPTPITSFIQTVPAKYASTLNRINGLINTHFSEQSTNMINAKFDCIVGCCCDVLNPKQLKAVILPAIANFTKRNDYTKICTVQRILYHIFKSIKMGTITTILNAFKRKTKSLCAMNNEMVVQSIQTKLKQLNDDEKHHSLPVPHSHQHNSAVQSADEEEEKKEPPPQEEPPPPSPQEEPPQPPQPQPPQQPPHHNNHNNNHSNHNNNKKK